MVSPNYTLQQDYIALSTTHQLYLKWRDRWQFLMESFVGGKEYRDAGHLTRYVLETDGEYQQRLLTTPYINHCQSVIQIYNSFLFRQNCDRDFASWEGRSDLESFLKDCDYEGRSFNDFMREVSTWSSVFGHCWVLMTKPNMGLATAQQEIDMGVRPNVNLITPLVCSDWTWSRKANGSYELIYLKYIEEVVDRLQIVKIWRPETVETWEMNQTAQTAELRMTEVNQLGFIPAVLVYNQRGIEKGIGVSDINDIADASKMIYNMMSENEQAIRLGTHPTLVVPPNAQIGAGAGAMIVLQEGSDPGLNPYALEFSSSAVNSIHETVSKIEDQIDKMANTGGVRTSSARTISGIALETEFQLLNARLATKADNLELAEEQIWRLFGRYQRLEWDGLVQYPDSFNIRDTSREIDQLVRAKSAATDPIVLKIIDGEILETLGKEAELLAYDDITPIPGRTYPDGEAIPESLPPSYRLAGTEAAPPQQNCANCGYWNGPEGYCNKFDATVRPEYYCVSWEKKHD